MHVGANALRDGIGFEGAHRGHRHRLFTCISVHLKKFRLSKSGSVYLNAFRFMHVGAHALRAGAGLEEAHRGHRHRLSRSVYVHLKEHQSV